MEVMDVVNYIVDKETKEGREATNVRVQELLYFCYAWTLLKTGKRLFDEPIRARNFGPVVLTVYEKYKIFNTKAIPCTAVAGNKSYIFPEEIKSCVDEILEECAKFSNLGLMNKITSQKPWIDAYNNYYDDIITDESIIKYHKR